MNVMDDVFFLGARALFFKYKKMASKEENSWMCKILEELENSACQRDRAIVLFGEIRKNLGSEELILLKKKGRAPLRCFAPEERAEIIKQRDIRRADRLRNKLTEIAQQAVSEKEISKFQSDFERHLRKIEKEQEKTESLPLEKKKDLTGQNYGFFKTEEGQEVIAVIHVLYEDGLTLREIARELMEAGYIQQNGTQYSSGTISYILNRYILNS